MHKVDIAATDGVLGDTLLIVIVLSKCSKLVILLWSTVFAQSGGGDGLLIIFLVLHDLPFMVSNIFGPDSKVAVDEGIYHGLSINLW